MPEKYLEENRFFYIESKLGPNELLLESFTGSEGISQLFSFQLELLSENKQIKFKDILGQEIAFGVIGPDPNEDPRRFHGIVTAFAQLPDTGRLSRYRAVVSPKLWILTQMQDCRIFQNLSVPEILQKVFTRKISIDFTMELQGSHPKRDYCVQYRETDFNFASRLMEEEGIFYFFRFERNSHKLVIADSKVSHQDTPGQSSVVYDETSGGLRDEARVSGWMKTQELVSGKVTLRDYNFETPTKDLEAKVPTQYGIGGNDHFEIYDYPGRYGVQSEGDRFAKLGMELMEASEFIIQGQSNIYYLTPGYRFTLTRHPNANGSYVLTSITHSASEGGFHSGSEIGQNHYSNSFRSIPYDMPYRPPRTTAKSRVWGCQTAVVVGPSGEEIYPDKYGRVKVQFHWDREGKKNESSSCWIRVATHWSGQGWGAIHLPRIGQEVVVDFLEGDPDMPLIVGSVYNAQKMPPYTLPANKTQSGIISESSKGGGGFNQIRFEDKKSSEEVLIHAQKDMNTMVEHDETLTVKHDETITISHDETIDIANNRTTTVGGNDKTTIGKDMTLNVAKNRSAMIGGSDTLTIAKDLTVTIARSETHTTAQSRTTNISSSDTLTTGGSVTITAGGGVSITAPTITLHAAVVNVDGIVSCMNLVAKTSVVSPTYTPGAGNVY
jgi:type VI secretion system secreted protein VgrG